MQDLLDYLELDISNTLGATVKGIAFTLFLGCLGYCLWEYSEWNAHRIDAGTLWTRIGLAYGGVAICIGLVAWIQRMEGFEVLSEKTRRGFRVITRKDKE